MSRADEMRTETKHALRRRLPWLLLVAGMALLVARYLARQPSDVTVELALGRARSGLQQARVVYQDQDGDPLAHAQFSFGQRRPPHRVRHTVRLPDGEYRAIIELRYAGAVPAVLRGQSKMIAPRTVRLTRPLLARGAGVVTIFVNGAR